MPSPSPQKVATAFSLSETIAQMERAPHGISSDRICAFYAGGERAEFLWGNKQGEAFEAQRTSIKINPSLEPARFATIDQSGAGKILAQAKQEFELSDGLKGSLGREASRLYARNVSGEVACFVVGAGERTPFSWSNDKSTLNPLERENAPSEVLERLAAAASSVPQFFKRDASKLEQLLSSLSSSAEKQSEAQLFVDRLRDFTRRQSIWLTIELPALLRNEKVTRLNEATLNTQFLVCPTKR